MKLSECLKRSLCVLLSVSMVMVTPVYGVEKVGDNIEKIITDDNNTENIYEENAENEGLSLEEHIEEDSIESVDICDVRYELEQTASYIYTGEAIEPTLKLTYNGEILRPDVDYTLSYKNNINAGAATITITGCGSFYGTTQTEFTICSEDISKANFSYSFPADTEEKTPNNVKIIGELNGKELIKDVDYELTVASADPCIVVPVNPGVTETAYMAIVGIGNYKGNKTISFPLNYIDRLSIPAVYVDSVSLSLDGDIGVNFYVHTEELDELEGAYIDINGVKNLVSAAELTENGRKFTYTVNAKSMHDNIEISAYDKDGNKLRLMDYSSNSEESLQDAYEYQDDVLDYRVADYLKNVQSMSDISEGLKNLTKAMYVYGQFAQNYFDYNLDSVENDIYAADAFELLKPYKRHTSGSCPSGIGFAGTSLVLESETTLRVYFSADNDISKYTFSLDGRKVSPIEKQAVYYIEIPDIPAAELGKAHVVTVTDGKAEWSLTTSALSYAYSVLNRKNFDGTQKVDKLTNLANALFYYYQAAKIYFGIEKDQSDEIADDDGILPFEGDLRSEAIRLSTIAANDFDQINYHDWTSFNRAVLNNVKRMGRLIIPGNEGEKDVIIYNTTGNDSGVYVFYGDTTGTWINVYMTVVDANSEGHTAKVYSGGWKNNKPNGVFNYTVVNEKQYSESSENGEQLIQDVKEYQGQVVDGGYDGNIKAVVTTSVFDYVSGVKQDDPEVSMHEYRNVPFVHGYIVDASEKKIKCRYCPEVMTFLADVYYGIDGIDTRTLIDYQSVSSNTILKGDVDELLQMAYELATSVEVDYEKWDVFTEESRDAGISFENYVQGRIDDDSYIAIYGGYNSDDIYIYYGDLNGAIRTGESLWLSATTVSKTDKDTGNKVYVRSYEKSNVTWKNDRPNGKFETILETEVENSVRKAQIIRRYNGEMARGVYNGVISWNVDSNSEYASGDQISSSHEYLAEFLNGYIYSDYYDSDGYVYVSSINGGYSEDKIHINKVYGLSGLPYETFVSDNTISRNSVTGNSISQNTVSANTVSENSVSMNYVSANSEYDPVSGNSSAILVTERIALLAREIATEDFNFETWRSLVKEANAKKIITKTEPYMYMMDDGTYIGIYKACTGDNYYIYCGDMSNWKRNGAGTWITAYEYSVYDNSHNKTDYLYFIDKTVGTWRKDRPEGSFEETITTHIDRIEKDYRTDITRVYRGSVDDGAFNGPTEWSVETSYSASDDYSIKKSSYGADFAAGYIQGFYADREGYVYVPSNYGGYSEDKISATKRYGYGGLGFAQSVSGDSISNNTVIEPEKVSGNSLSGNNVSGNYISGNVINYNEGMSLVSANTASKYPMQNLVSMAYDFMRSDSIDADAWEDFKKECIRGGITASSPIIAEMEDGLYVGIYGGYEQNAVGEKYIGDDIYLYYGAMTNLKREGKGLWLNISSSDYYEDGTRYTAVVTDRTEAVWKRDYPNGVFTEEHIIEYSGGDRNVRINRTYSGKTRGGAFNGDIGWQVDSLYISSDGTSENYGHAYSAQFENGYIKGFRPDAEGYVYIESTNGGYSYDKLYATKFMRIPGLLYTQKKSTLYEISMNNVVNVSQNDVDTKQKPEEVELSAKDTSNKIVKESLTKNLNFKTDNETLLSVAYDLVKEAQEANTEPELAAAINYEDWYKLTKISLAKGVRHDEPIASYIEDGEDAGQYIAIYKGYNEDAVYIYLGRMYNWKRSGDGIWMSVSGGVFERDEEECEAHYIYKARTHWKNDEPTGNFSEIVLSNIEQDSDRKGDKARKITILKKYSGSTDTGAYDGEIRWDTDAVYLNGNDGTSSSRSFKARFNLGFIDEYISESDGYAYVPSTNGGYAEEKINIHKNYGIHGIKYAHTVSGNTVSANSVSGNDDYKGDFPVVKIAPKNVQLFGNVNITSTISDEKFNYKWQKSIDGEVWTNVEGADSSINVMATDSCYYRVIVTKPNGQVVTSDKARVNIITGFGEVTTQPVNGYYVSTEGPLEFEVKYTGYAVGRNWQISYDGGNTWNDAIKALYGAEESIDILGDETYNTTTFKLKGIRAIVQGLIRAELTDVNGVVHYSDVVNLNVDFDNTFKSGNIGKDGDTVIYKLAFNHDGDVIMELSGNGFMSDYSAPSKQPWGLVNRNAIKKIIVREGVTGIGDYTLSSMINLSELEIANSVENIGDSAFEGDVLLSNLSLPKNLEGIGSRAFAGCKGILGDVKIPKSVSYIGNRAFEGDIGISRILIFGGKPRIGDGAFEKTNSMGNLPITIVCYENSDVFNWAVEQGFSVSTVAKAPTLGYFNVYSNGAGGWTSGNFKGYETINDKRYSVYEYETHVDYGGYITGSQSWVKRDSELDGEITAKWQISTDKVTWTDIDKVTDNYRVYNQEYYYWPDSYYDYSYIDIYRDYNLQGCYLRCVITNEYGYEAQNYNSSYIDRYKLYF